MTKSTRRLLENRGVKLAQQVATLRLQKSGIRLGGELRFSTGKITKKDRLPPRLLKRLAGI